MRPLFRRSRPGVFGVFAARRCIARTPKGVEGAPTPLLRGVNREAERFPDGVVDVKRRGVRGYLVWPGRR